MNTETLRKKILDLAIRGKLVPQDPNDEPASVLLERIRTQKAQMVKDGKLKAKDVKNDTIIYVGEDNLHYEKFADGTVKCIEGEIPFAMPEGWAWARLKNITLSIRDGSHNPPIDKGHGIPMLSAVNINNNIINIHGATRWVTEEEWEIENKRTNIALGDVLLTIVGTIGRSAVVETDEHFALQRSVSVLKPCMISSFYLMYILQTPYVFKWLSENSKGTAQKGIYLNTLSTLMIPIPPLNEEQEIVKILENSNESIIHIEKSKDYLFNLTSMARSKILDLAIRGKLVSQDKQDEPASVLLERIRAEKEELIRQGKIKRNKKESVIYRGADNSYYERFADGSEKCINEEIPFEIPKGWAWGRIFSITTDLSYGTAKKSLTKGKIAVIRMGNIQAGEINYDDLMYSSDEADILKYCLEKNDLLFNRTNSPDLVGKTAIYRGDIPAIYAGYLIRIHTFIDSEYLNIVMNSNYARRYYNLVKTDGVNQSNINAKKLAVFIIPIPPFEEQRRIAKQEKTIRSILFECMR